MGERALKAGLGRFWDMPKRDGKKDRDMYMRPERQVLERFSSG
jgi:hypothetical protein